MAYESLLLLALLLVATFIFLMIFGPAVQPLKRHFLQLWLLIVAGTYFCWLWVHGGQTLAMKTWRIRLLTEQGGTLSWRTAVLRFLVAVPSVCLGIGILWALVDSEGRFLQDRLLHTRLVRAD